MPLDTDPQFHHRWDMIVLAICSAFGWTMAQTEDEMDPIRLRAVFELWKEFPPTFMALRSLGGGDGKRSGARVPAHAPGVRGWTPPEGNTLPDDIMAGNVEGFGARRVPPDYYKNLKARLDAGTQAYIAHRQSSPNGDTIPPK